MPLFGRPTELPDAPDKWKDALEAALRVSEIASSAAALPEAVQAMAQSATELLGAEQGSIMLLEESGRNLVLVASCGLPTDAPLGYRLVVGESVAGRVLATGKALLLGDVDRNAFVNFVPKTKQITSSIVVPLRVNGRAIGVLNLAVSDITRRFTDDDLRVAQMFADQAAGIIYRARLHERAEQRSSDLMALVESSRGLLGTLDIEALLQSVLDGGSRLAGSKDGFACLFDADTGGIAQGVFRGIDKQAIRELVDRPEVQTAVGSVDVGILEADLGTLVAVGLRTSHETRGVFVVAADKKLAFERTDLLRAFGQQCSTAIGAAESHVMIQRKESELASIIQGVPNPIVLVDHRTNIVAVNPAAEQLFRISSMFSSGTPVVGALGNPEVEALLTSEGDIQAEIVAGSPPRTYKARVADVRQPGALRGRVLLMDDVTMEREMAQTQRDFVAMIGHELRTPLTIIKGFAKTLLRRVDRASVDEQKEALSTIDHKTAQLERLIEDLLYVSKIESREASLRIDQVDIPMLIKTVVEDLVQMHTDREIVLDAPVSLSWPCDETKIALVLRHLVENALKYSDAPHPVTVRAFGEADELRIDVVDSGIGILSSDIPHIFERFHQIDSSSTRAHGGTGVGLYLCAQLVRVHGGRIWVDSTWGKGSTFSFSLPGRTTGREVVRIHGDQVRDTA